MNIAVVSDSIYPYNKGGKEKRLFEITKRLSGYGHQITIYTMKWWPGPDQTEENGVKLVSIGKLKKLYTKERRRSLTEALFFGLRVFLPLLKTKYDFIITDHIPYLHLFSLKIVCLLKGKLLITDWLEVWGKKNWIEYLGFFKGYLAFIIEWLSTKIPNNIISISDFTTKRLIHDFKVNKKKISTFPCGIELEDIKQAKSQSDRHSDCIFVGRLLKHKNVDMMIRAIKYVADHGQPTIRCLIIGDGPEKPYLEKLANRLNLQKNITFLGFIAEHKDVYAYMKSSKIFVFPSAREGFGIVVLEANACGLPVLAVKSDFSASADLISENVNGYLLDPSPEEIGKAIINLLASPQRLNDLSQKSITFAKNYSWETIVKQMENNYKNIFLAVNL